uniref:Glabrous enhancer-binding protein-like DBD domain-containing protein n=3 Tax=Oryza sativa subsp. japonica TaxID=39947 RepID=Q69K16_ORYSJ|nr:hypothetical protein [Oryza sativa Japonica Group]BAD36685.1 hypothetical protein [Oryza sativa Japonica Group]
MRTITRARALRAQSRRRRNFPKSQEAEKLRPAMSSWWSWRSLFSSLANANGGGSNADASSGSGTSSSPPVHEAQQAAARRRSARTKKPPEEEAAGSQPQPKTRPSPASKASKAKVLLLLGDGEPKKKPAPNPTPTQKRSNKRKRSWSRADELRILEAMANHANAHGGALPEASDLFAALASSLERGDADLPKLADKVHKLKRWYDNARLPQRCPTDDDDDTRRLFQLCGKVWGPPSTVLRTSPRQRHKVVGVLVQGNGANPQPAAALKVKEKRVRRELSELYVLYPCLAQEVKAHANEYGELIGTAFQFIGDDEARCYDDRYRKMLVDKLNMKKEHADVTKSLLCTLAGYIN